MSTPERLAGARALLRFLARQDRLGSDDVTRVEAALADGAAVHEILEREGLISQKDLALLLAETLRLRIVDLTTYPLDANVTRELKETIATRYEVVPIAIDARTIEVVTANPLDLDGLKAVEFATGKRVQPVVATHVEVKDALAHTYRLQESLEQFLQLVPAGETLVVNELSDEGDDLRSIAADAELPPVIKLADKMLIEGIKSRASDIHVEPEGDSVLVRYRVDGILEEAFRFPKWIQNPLVARLKVMAKLDITERRLPQDGRIQVRYLDKSVDMRVSSLPAQHGEKITLRILDASQAVKALDRLGFAPSDLKLLRDAAKKPQGMILITGPTGSGKTTTLYALLREIFSPKTNIVTIENPIEYQLKGINQVEVNEKQGLTFGGVLRSVLRQDPDVILLGEIRDKETAQIAFQAAATGHLVLSTVHTNDAAGAVTRLMDLGLEPYAIASALNLVVAQRLVRQLCPSCATPVEIDPETRRQLHLGDDARPKQPVGCVQCRHQGYRSRLGVYELLPMTSATTKLIEAGAGESMVRQQARSEGAHSMLDDAADKVRAGVTSVEEVQRVVQITDGGGAQCPGCQKEIAEDYSVCPHCSKVLRASCSGCAKPLNSEWVRCPYCGAAATVEEPPAESRRSFTALVVDDTATIRDVVRHTLEHSDLGLTVTTAEDGPQALEIAGRERPDIVILDISMPGMDGFEVCRRLRSEMRTAFVPVLMLTAHDSEDDVAKGFGVGADDYMVKPFRREGLVARVKRILERTYGSQAVGAPPLPDTTAGPAPTSGAETIAYAPPDGAVAASVAELVAESEALRSVVAGVDARFETVVARLEQLGAQVGDLAARTVSAEARAAALPPSGHSTPELADLRTLVGELRASQERCVAEIRADAARALAAAEEALASARAAAMSGVNFSAMTSTLEQLQGEHVQLQAAVRAAAAASEDTGADEECERRLRQVAAEIEELRTVTATLEAALQGEALAATERVTRDLAAVQRDLQAEAAARVADAARVVEVEAAARQARADIDTAVDAAMRALRHEMATLGGHRDVDAAVGARLDGVAERVESLATRVDALVPRLDVLADETREIAAARAAVDALRADVEAVRRQAEAARDEAGAARRDTESARIAADASGREMDVLRGAIDAVHGRFDASGEAFSALQRRTAAIGESLAAVQGRVDAGDEALTAVRARVDAGGESIAALQGRADAADATLAAVRAEVAAAGDHAAAVVARIESDVDALRATSLAVREEASAVRGDAAAIAARLDRELETLRTEMGGERRDTAALDERLHAGEQAVVALRDAVEGRLGTHEERLGWLETRLVQTRRLAVRLVRRAWTVDRAMEADNGRRAADTDRCLAAIRDEVRSAIDQLRRDHAALVARIGTEDGSATLAEQRLGTELRALEAVVTRMDGDHRRHAEHVEERLRNVMRTAAGGFDVQLALLRGKVEVLARTLRDQVPLDPAAPTEDGLLQHRHGLMATLRDQLATLQNGADWRPQRVLDLLVETSLAAAMSPLRRILQLAQGAPSERAAVADATASDVTDESTPPG